MALIKPDFSEAGEPITPGVYAARIIEAQATTAKTSGAPMVKWKFEVFGAQNPKYNGQSVTMNTMVSGPGAGNLKRLLNAALGSVPPEFDTEHLLGKQLVITLKESVDQRTGEKREWPEVSRVAPFDAKLVANGSQSAPF